MKQEDKGIIVEGLCLAPAAGQTPETREITHEVSFTVPPGGVLGIVGESGCGKSLTCQAVMGLLPPGVRRRGGRIRVDGREVAPQAASRMFRGKKIAMILQNPSGCFNPLRTVAAHFQDTLRSHDLPCSRQRMEDALREAGFADARRIPELYPYEMSGGMLQRVMIALALVLEAPYLVADEPTTDLDPVAQKRVLDLLERLRARKGVGILLVSHDLSVMRHLADRVAVMYQGRILEQAPTEELFRAPRTPYGRRLVNAHGLLCRAWRGTSMGAAVSGAVDAVA